MTPINEARCHRKWAYKYILSRNATRRTPLIKNIKNSRFLADENMLGAVKVKLCKSYYKSIAIIRLENTKKNVHMYSAQLVLQMFLQKNIHTKHSKMTTSY